MNLQQLKILKSQEDIYLGTVYFSPENSTREKRLQKDHFTNLTEMVAKFDSDNIILLGDFSARSGNLNEIVNNDKHIHGTLPTEFCSTIDTRWNEHKQANISGPPQTLYVAELLVNFFWLMND